MSNFAKRIREWHKHKELIKKGILIPVKSYEEYVALVKEAKQKASNKVFTNCYMLSAEIKRLIRLKLFFKVKTDAGLVFVDDEGSYYYLFLYVDMSEAFTIPLLEKDILVENVYYEERKTEIQCKFENFVQNIGFSYLNTYNAITDRPQIPPEKYWKKLTALQNALIAEDKKITIPKEWQLEQFEKVYRETIDKYVQKRYSLKERKKQRALGYLHCIDDERGNIYAIHISGILHGGAIATRKDCQGGIYSPGLMLYVFKEFYEAMPEDAAARKEYMRSKGIGGWIAVDNKASWRMHKMIGMHATGKSMNQFVIKAK